MTHPFHPRHGCELELIERMAMTGVEWVHYTGEDGTRRTIRQAITSVAAVDPFVQVATGRWESRISDLRALVALLDGLGGDDWAAEETDDGAETVKKISPHV